MKISDIFVSSWLKKISELKTNTKIYLAKKKINFKFKMFLTGDHEKLKLLLPSVIEKQFQALLLRQS